MRRSWLVWTAFSLCAAVLAAAMGWTSREVLRLDRAEAEARRQALLEENVRLALWRMDTMLAPLLAREGARPYFSYRTLVPVDLANGRVYNRTEDGGKTSGAPAKRPWLMPGADDWGGLPAEMLVPSPLLQEGPPHVLVHFQFEPDGQLTSPQVPAGAVYKLAVPEHVGADTVVRAQERLEEVAALTDRARLIGLLPPSELGPVAVVFSAPQPAPGQSLSQIADQLPGQPGPYQDAQKQGPQQFVAQAQPQSLAQQARRGQLEFEQRSRAVQQQANTMVQNLALNPWNDLSWAATDMTGVLMTPLWLDGHLVLARRVTAGGREYVQGCLLDWPGIRAELLLAVADLLPGARLEPTSGPPPQDAGARMLAALPLRLVPGTLAGGADPGVSPVRLSLAVAWTCVLLAAGAVAGLLWGVMRLSERRAAFVSAVTHELRTPLTTFRLYSEMLAEGMVPKDQERPYLQTLQTEAARLTHLVENVLAYARLERGRSSGRVEEVPLDRLIEQVEGRLAERARQAGMELVVEPGAACAGSSVRANPSAVEQVLFNLVDNACKYAAAAEDRRIHLETGRTDGRTWLRVRDHGPGLAPAALRRLFRSFSKSARDAANSAPGVGLGLALSYRLARDQGARLALDRGVTDGAAFTLTLPTSGSG